MDCPRCGYALSPFDKDCPRCKRLGPAVPPLPQTHIATPTLQPQQSVQKKKPDFGKMILVLFSCVVPVVALIVFVVMLTLPHRSAPPGPETLRLETEMRHWASADSQTFFRRFGMPASTHTTEIQGVKYVTWTYPCRDGEVFLAFNVPLQIIERIDTQGK